MRVSLTDEIQDALNRHSAENVSNTPDFILAQFLVGCLSAWNEAVQERERWYKDRLAPLATPEEGDRMASERLTRRYEPQPEFPDAAGPCCAECGDRFEPGQQGVLVGNRLYCDPCWHRATPTPTPEAHDGDE